MEATTLDRWHQQVRSKSPHGLEALFADHVTLHSPVVYEPQVGHALTVRHLTAAFQVFREGGFRYTRELADPKGAVLEFEVELEGVLVNGVDMLRWNEQGEIVEFKVMIRPFQALKMLQRTMATVL